MPRLSEFRGIAILIHFNDHNPPHFHATYNGAEALFTIETLTVLAGTLPNDIERRVRAWAEPHQNELRANWDRAVRKESLVKIAP